MTHVADRSAAAVEMAAQPLWELALHHVAVITVIAIIAITDIAPAAGLWWQSDVLAESPSQQDAQSSPPLDSAESNATDCGGESWPHWRGQALACVGCRPQNAGASRGVCQQLRRPGPKA